MILNDLNIYVYDFDKADYSNLENIREGRPMILGEVL
jgi:hypothetical protein